MTRRAGADEGAGSTKRADARRNEAALLDAAAEVFTTAGVQAPVRQIAAHAGVGVATIYRHFPTRSDLVVAVYRHQVQTCAQAGPRLLEECSDPWDALLAWVELFVGFLVTKHGLAEALRSDDESFQSLHDHFLNTLVPVCADLISACVAQGRVEGDVDAYELMRGVGNLCIGAGDRYDPRRLVALLLNGLRR